MRVGGGIGFISTEVCLMINLFECYKSGGFKYPHCFRIIVPVLSCKENKSVLNYCLTRTYIYFKFIPGYYQVQSREPQFLLSHA